MTKKFWKDFQKRIGETKNIYLFGKIYNNDGSFAYYIGKWPSPLLNKNDRLVKANFYNDEVNLVIERHRTVLTGSWGWYTHIENEYKTLHREDIATIEFIKQGKNE